MSKTKHSTRCMRMIDNTHTHTYTHTYNLTSYA